MHPVSDPAARQQAHSALTSMFTNLGSGGAGPGSAGMVAQLEEFIQMPMELTKVFLDMSVQLTEMVLKTLEEAGVILVKGMTPM